MNRRILINLLGALLITTLGVANSNITYASSNGMGGGMGNGNGMGSMDDKNHDDDQEHGDDDDDDQEQALQAVKAEQALPLKHIIKIFKKEISGKIIDISLYKRSGKLTYRFKYIDDSGHVRKAYFDPSTGSLIDR